MSLRGLNWPWVATLLTDILFCILNSKICFGKKLCLPATRGWLGVFTNRHWWQIATNCYSDCKIDCKINAINISSISYKKWNECLKDDHHHTKARVHLWIKPLWAPSRHSGMPELSIDSNLLPPMCAQSSHCWIIKINYRLWQKKILHAMKSYAFGTHVILMRAFGNGGIKQVFAMGHPSCQKKRKIWDGDQ